MSLALSDKILILLYVPPTLLPPVKYSHPSIGGLSIWMFWEKFPTANSLFLESLTKSCRLIHCEVSFYQPNTNLDTSGETEPQTEKLLPSDLPVSMSVGAFY